MSATQVIKQLKAALQEAYDHLEWCNYGDAWESECARDAKLRQQIETALALTEDSDDEL